MLEGVASNSGHGAFDAQPIKASVDAFPGRLNRTLVAVPQVDLKRPNLPMATMSIHRFNESTDQTTVAAEWLNDSQRL